MQLNIEWLGGSARMDIYYFDKIRNYKKKKKMYKLTS